MLTPFVLMLIESTAHSIADVLDVVRRVLAERRRNRVEGR